MESSGAPVRTSVLGLCIQGRSRLFSSLALEAFLDGLSSSSRAVSSWTGLPAPNNVPGFSPVQRSRQCTNTNGPVFLQALMLGEPFVGIDAPPGPCGLPRGVPLRSP